ncbi:MAG: RDD family protein [Pseudomonadota bacterium]
MKCRKCGFTNPDYVDSCKNCQKDLTETRSMLGNLAATPEQVCFLSKLLRSDAEMNPHEESAASSLDRTMPTMGEESMLSDSEESPPPAFDLAQIDFSDLQNAPEVPESVNQTKSPGETGVPEDEPDILQIELPDLEIEAKSSEETKGAERAEGPVFSEIDFPGLHMELPSEKEVEPEVSEEPSFPQLEFSDLGMAPALPDETGTESPEKPGRPHLDLSDFGIGIASQEETGPGDSEKLDSSELDFAGMEMEIAPRDETRNDASEESDLPQLDFADLEITLNSPGEQRSPEESEEARNEADRIFLDLDDKASLDFLLQPEEQPSKEHEEPPAIPAEDSPNKTIRLDKAGRTKRGDKDKTPPPASTGASGRKGRGGKKSKDPAPALAFSGLRDSAENNCSRWRRILVRIQGASKGAYLPYVTFGATRKTDQKTRKVGQLLLAASLNLHLDRAGFFRRLWALAFDLCLLSLLMLFLMLATVVAVRTAPGSSEGVSDFIALVLSPLPFGMILFAAVYSVFFHGYSGQTPGKMLFDLKVVHTSGLPLNYAHSFLRLAGAVLSAIPLSLGFFWAAFDKNRQTWHDKLTDTYVIRII